MVYTTTKIVYSATQIFGFDSVKTSVWNHKEDAIDDAERIARMLKKEDEPVTVIENENEEILYIIRKSEDPSEYVAVLIRRCEVK